MKKNKSYLFLLLLLLVFFLIGYKLLNKPKEIQVLEINFISDTLITNSTNDILPQNVSIFSDVYSENNLIDFVGKVSFKRKDFNNSSTDTIRFSSPYFKIPTMEIEDVKTMFESEKNQQYSTSNMSLPSDGSESDISKDTNSTRYFYLVTENQMIPDGRKVFSDAGSLKSYIVTQLKENTLFTGGVKQNKIVVLLISKRSKTIQLPKNSHISIPKKDSPVSGVIINNPVNIENEKTPVKSSLPKVIQTDFKRIDGQNIVQWSNDLAKYAISIKIRFSTKDEVFADEDVTGLKKYTYNPGTSRAQGKKTKVELIVDFGDNNIKLQGPLTINNEFFLCSSN